MLLYTLIDDKGRHRARPLPYQLFNVNFNVRCCKAVRESRPIGTIIYADRLTGSESGYYRAGYIRRASDDEISTYVISKKTRIPKNGIYTRITDERFLDALTAYGITLEYVSKVEETTDKINVWNAFY